MLLSMARAEQICAYFGYCQMSLISALFQLELNVATLIYLLNAVCGDKLLQWVLTPIQGSFIFQFASPPLQITYS